MFGRIFDFEYMLSVKYSPLPLSCVWYTYALSINNCNLSRWQSVEGENHERAVELLKAASVAVKLVVRYTPRVLEEMELRFDRQRTNRGAQQ